MTHIRIIGLYLMVCLLCGCSSAIAEPEASTNQPDQTASVRQASPYQYTELEDEFQIDLSGIDRDDIEDISYALLGFSEEKDRDYSLIMQKCKPSMDSSGIVHIPKQQEICTLYVPESNAYFPLYRLEQEGENSWSTEFTRIGIKKNNYLTDVWTILKLTGEGPADQYLQYSLKQRFRVGVNPFRAEYLMTNGTHLINSFLHMQPTYNADGYLEPVTLGRQSGFRKYALLQSHAGKQTTL